MENPHARLLSIRGVIHALPRANFDLLKRVAEHLDKCVFFLSGKKMFSSHHRVLRVTDFEEQNHMTAEALAIVFSPNLLRAPQNDFALILANMGYTHKLVKALITHVRCWIEGYEHDTDLKRSSMSYLTKITRQKMM